MVANNHPMITMQTKIPSRYAESFEAWLWDQGVLAVTLGTVVNEQLELTVLFQEESTNLNVSTINQWFSSQAIEPPHWDRRVADTTAWRQNRREAFETMFLGNICLLAKDQHPPSGLDLDQIKLLRVFSDYAFGTGDHATTRLVIRAMQEYSFAGASVLDAGCGTGILGIAAEMLGAKHCDGFDNDPESLPNMRLHLEMNQSKRCKLWLGGFESVPNRTYDWVLANVTLNVHREMLGHLARWSHQETKVLGSGIQEDQWQETVAAYAAFGWTVDLLSVEDEWLCFKGVKQ